MALTWDHLIFYECDFPHPTRVNSQQEWIKYHQTQSSQPREARPQTFYSWCHMDLHEHSGKRQPHVLCHAGNPNLDPTVQTGRRNLEGDLWFMRGRRCMINYKPERRHNVMCLSSCHTTPRKVKQLENINILFCVAGSKTDSINIGQFKMQILFHLYSSVHESPKVLQHSAPKPK